MTDTKTVHPKLYFEERRVKESQMQLDWLNDLFNDCQELFGDEWIDDHLYTYGCGIEFRELDKQDYQNVKEMVSKRVEGGLGELQKESSTYAVKFSRQSVIGRIEAYDKYAFEQKMKPVDMTVTFKWGVPDTCEIVETAQQEDITDEIVESEGRVYRQTIRKELKCNKPLLEAVFDNQKSEQPDA